MVRSASSWYSTSLFISTSAEIVVNPRTRETNSNVIARYCCNPVSGSNELILFNALSNICELITDWIDTSPNNFNPAGWRSFNTSCRQIFTESVVLRT